MNGLKGKRTHEIYYSKSIVTEDTGDPFFLDYFHGQYLVASVLHQ